MANDVAVIDRFLDIFSRYIDSGFGLISGDVGFLVKILIGIDVVVAALAWAAGEDEVIQAFAKKILYVGFFAFILNSWNGLAQVIFNSFAALGLKATGSSLSYADFLRPGKLAQAGVQGADGEKRNDRRSARADVHRTRVEHGRTEGDYGCRLERRARSC